MVEAECLYLAYKIVVLGGEVVSGLIRSVVGLVVYWVPKLSEKAGFEVVPGQIVMVGAGIYLCGIGGVRIEGDILVTESGKKNQCSLPNGLKSAMICI